MVAGAYAGADAHAYGFNAGTGGNIDVKGDAGITVRARGGAAAGATATA
ncbi:MAG: hypothetical protein LUC29_10400 [Acidaminococcaceae bacterium]|nr:hypothetical protein [Acidaminococcaceae bacterium]